MPPLLLPAWISLSASFLVLEGKFVPLLPTPPVSPIPHSPFSDARQRIEANRGQFGDLRDKLGKTKDGRQTLSPSTNKLNSEEGATKAKFAHSPLADARQLIQANRVQNGDLRDSLGKLGKIIDGKQTPSTKFKSEEVATTRAAIPHSPIADARQLIQANRGHIGDLRDRLGKTIDGKEVLSGQVMPQIGRMTKMITSSGQLALSSNSARSEQMGSSFAIPPPRQLGHETAPDEVVFRTLNELDPSPERRAWLSVFKNFMVTKGMSLTDWPFMYKVA